MTSKSHVCLQSLSVFNSTLATKEGEEHKKILFYHPPSTALDTQIRNVGLCEAIIKFTSTFNPEKECEVVYTQKTKQYFLHPEKDFSIVMTIAVPCSQRSKEGQIYTEYHGDDVQDNVFQAILKQTYNMYRFFKGTFSSSLSRDIRGLKQKLESFFSTYFLSLKLQYSDILDVYNGILFLPLDKTMFLRVQCLVNYIEASFPHVKHSAFLYNDHLVWSGLEQEDMQVMYRYLTANLFPAFLETEFSGGALTPVRAGASPFSQPHYGRYVTGPPNVNDTSQPGRVVKVFVNTAQKTEKYHLLVYRALNANICLLVQASFQLNFDFYKKLDSFLGPQLTSLASGIGEQYSRRPQSGSLQLTEPQCKYIYFNHINLAQRSTVHPDNRRTGNIGVPPDVMRLVADLNWDVQRMSSCSEVIVRTMSDYWVVAKYSDQRELYIILLQKTATLMDINDEVRRLIASQFTNLFLVD